VQFIQVVLFRLERRTLSRSDDTRSAPHRYRPPRTPTVMLDMRSGTGAVELTLTPVGSGGRRWRGGDLDLMPRWTSWLYTSPRFDSASAGGGGPLMQSLLALALALAAVACGAPALPPVQPPAEPAARPPLSASQRSTSGEVPHVADVMAIAVGVMHAIGPRAQASIPTPRLLGLSAVDLVNQPSRDQAAVPTVISAVAVSSTLPRPSERSVESAMVASSSRQRAGPTRSRRSAMGAIVRAITCHSSRALG